MFGRPARGDDCVDRGAYIFCVLEQFWRHLKRREIYAEASTRWRNPQARLLDGPAWEAVKPDVLVSLGLPEAPDALLAAHAATLDQALRYVGGRLAGNTYVRVDAAGKVHVTADEAIEEPPSLTALRKRVAGMLPQIDIGDLILEVMTGAPSSWPHRPPRVGAVPDRGPGRVRGGLPDRAGPQHRVRAGLQ